MCEKNNNNKPALETGNSRHGAHLYAGSMRCGSCSRRGRLARGCLVQCVTELWTQGKIYRISRLSSQMGAFVKVVLFCILSLSVGAQIISTLHSKPRAKLRYQPILLQSEPVLQNVTINVIKKSD